MHDFRTTLTQTLRRARQKLPAARAFVQARAREHEALTLKLKLGEDSPMRNLRAHLAHHGPRAHFGKAKIMRHNEADFERGFNRPAFFEHINLFEEQRTYGEQGLEILRAWQRRHGRVEQLKNIVVCASEIATRMRYRLIDCIGQNRSEQLEKLWAISAIALCTARRRGLFGASQYKISLHKSR